MIHEIEIESHIIVKSKDLYKIIKSVRLKTVKLCTQKFYKYLIDDLENKNNSKILFLFKRTPKLFEQYWSEIYKDNKFSDEKYLLNLKECATKYTENAELFKKLESLSELSETGEVILSKNDAYIYNQLKKHVCSYDHNHIKNVNDNIFNIIVKMIYNLVNY